MLGKQFRCSGEEMYLYRFDKEMNQLPARKEVDANHLQGARGEEQQMLVAHQNEKYKLTSLCHSLSCVSKLLHQ